MEMTTARVLQHVRFRLSEKSNLDHIDVLEIDRNETVEVWVRSVRREHSPNKNGGLEVWELRKHMTFDNEMQGRRDFESRTGHLIEEIVLQYCSTTQLAPPPGVDRFEPDVRGVG